MLALTPSMSFSFFTLEEFEDLLCKDCVLIRSSAKLVDGKSGPSCPWLIGLFILECVPRFRRALCLLLAVLVLDCFLL